MRVEGASSIIRGDANPTSGDYVLRKLNPSEPVVSANAAPSARKARTTTSAKAPVARAAKHSKAVIGEPVTASSNAAPVAAAAAVAVAFEPVVDQSAEEIVVQETVTATVAAVSREAIARLAYSYWVERGYQDGNPQEDWARAEQSLLS
jgi:hypothetical protein